MPRRLDRLACALLALAALCCLPGLLDSVGRVAGLVAAGVQVWEAGRRAARKERRTR